MYTAQLVCSDPLCAEEIAGETATLGELGALVCDCGCALEVVGWPDVAAEPLAQIIMLRAARAGAARRPSRPSAASRRRRPVRDPVGCAPTRRPRRG